jgi:hypothetical protein
LDIKESYFIQKLEDYEIIASDVEYDEEKENNFLSLETYKKWLNFMNKKKK